MYLAQIYTDVANNQFSDMTGAIVDSALVT